VKPRQPATRWDLATLVGGPLALALVVGGQWLEGGRLESILQGTAALIVFWRHTRRRDGELPGGGSERAVSALKDVFQDRPRVVCCR
jgi:flagellar motor component MotA